MCTTIEAPVPTAMYRGAQQRATHLGAPFGRTPTAQQGEPPAPPSSIVKSYSGKVRVTPPKQQKSTSETPHNTSKLKK